MRSPVPAPSATSAPALRSATTAPLRWVRYSTSVGAVIYVPATWTVLAPAAAAPYSFAASPDGPHAPLADRTVRATLLSLRLTRPLTVDEFADQVLAGPLAGTKVERFAATHPAGPVVLLRYVFDQRDRSVGQQVDALLVRDGTGWILGTRTPLDQREQNASVLVEILQRFRPN